MESINFLLKVEVTPIMPVLWFQVSCGIRSGIPTNSESKDGESTEDVVISVDPINWDDSQDTARNPQCSMCQKTCKDLEDLAKHRETHEKRDFVCEICHKVGKNLFTEF